MNSDLRNPGHDHSPGDVPLDPQGIRVCATCKTPLSADVSGVFCPVCMLRSALGDTAESPGEGFAVSTLEGASSEYGFEHYELVKCQDGRPIELGRGAMGVTYKAFDVGLRCPVALKVITEKYLGDESARLRFLREARAAASVRHSNVASVLHLGRRGEDYFYAMEFVEGETLKHLIQRFIRLEVNLALEIATQVAAGLGAVHKQKLVHRDIKPANIMVCLDERGGATAKIIDLGLAKATSESPSEAAISIPGCFVGTPECASPEQFAAVGVDIRSDLYSLGVTLWEMLTGNVPFQGSPAEVMYQHQHAPLPLNRLKNVPQPVVVLLEVLLEKDPKERFQSPAELLNALPKVTDAINAGHSITHQSLRAIADEQFGTPGKATGILAGLQALVAIRGIGLIRWFAVALLIVSGLILVVNAFLRNGRRVPDTSTHSLSAIEAPEKSIAVLPFESLSDDKSDIYFADGVQDEILSSLAKVSQLKVISRTSVMTYRPSGNRDLRSIAGALGVAHVLEGTVRRDGNRVRVTTELIDARTDKTLWSDSYDRDLTDIFAIQSDIAKLISSKLSAQLSGEEKQKLEEKPTDDLEAYDLYLRAKDLIANAILYNTGDTRESLLQGIRYLEQATRRDSKFAFAYCLTAKADDWLYLLDLDKTPARRALGDAAVDEALRLRPDLPEVQLAAAFHRYRCYRDYEKARVMLAIAEQALPNSPEALALAANMDRRQGKWEESTKAFEKASNLDPRNPEVVQELATNYLFLRRYRDCAQTYNRLIETAPDKPSFKVLEAYAAFLGNADLIRYRAALEALPSSMKNESYIASWRFICSVYGRDWSTAKEILSDVSNEEIYFSDAGAMVPAGCVEIWLALLQEDHSKMEARFAEVRDELNRKVEAHPEDPKLISALGLIDAALGRKQKAIQESKRAVEMLPVSEDSFDGPALVENLAIVYAWTNEADLAFREAGISVKTPGGIAYGELKLDPAWDPLRKDPRFEKLVAHLAPKE